MAIWANLRRQGDQPKIPGKLFGELKGMVVRRAAWRPMGVIDGTVLPWICVGRQGASA
jgi:hypothetical protein